MKKVLLTGNEAIARGFWEAGVHLGTGYPGTPSTEILENLALMPSVRCQWATNEKIAAEVAIGASISGSRAICTMKHVGVNVAADPIFSFAYTGPVGGMVLCSADEPGMHSSQNEQDNRIYARFAKLGLLEPSDSQECKDFAKLALELSETYRLAFLLRSTTRISLSKSSVELNDRIEVPIRNYEKNAERFITMPANARRLRVDLEQRLKALQEYAETTDINRIIWQGKKIGIVTSGMTYQYVREALPDASVFKLGLTYPLPLQKLAAFAAEVDQLYVVEELEPFLEEQLKMAGIDCIGKEIIPNIGELSPNIIRKAFGITIKKSAPAWEAPARPPVLCPGCPHRSVFYTLSKLGCTVTGDIGCYTLGAIAPLNGIDTTICMGAALPMALGMEISHPEIARKLVAVHGDSTFLHSGMTGLLEMVYNNASSLVMILDNGITAMTGHQHNPASGKHIDNSQASQVDFEAICRALGVKRVREVDAYDLDTLNEAVKAELASEELSVIIVRRACALIVPRSTARYSVNTEKCVSCKMCMQLGCPALSMKDKAEISPELCANCGVCTQVCKFQAIVKEEV